jgi:hypothetical protein
MAPWIDRGESQGCESHFHGQNAESQSRFERDADRRLSFRLRNLWGKVGWNGSAIVFVHSVIEKVILLQFVSMMTSCRVYLLHGLCDGCAYCEVDSGHFQPVGKLWQRLPPVGVQGFNASTYSTAVLGSEASELCWSLPSDLAHTLQS